MNRVNLGRSAVDTIYGFVESNITNSVYNSVKTLDYLFIFNNCYRSGRTNYIKNYIEGTLFERLSY